VSEVDRARRALERGDGRTWRERALDAEAELSRLRGRVEQAEKERDEASDALQVLAADHYFARAEKAEAENAELAARVEQAEKALETISNMRYLGTLTVGPHPFIEARAIADDYFAARAAVSTAPEEEL